MLTELTVRTAGPGLHWDNTLKGFGLRVGRNRRTFIVLVASGRRKAIGHYPSTSLADARKAARLLLAEKTLGKVRPTYTAFEDARSDFLRECEQRNRPGTVAEYKRLLTRHFPFGRQGVADITPRQIVQRLNALNDRPGEKHHGFTVCRAFFRWCVRQQLTDRSPLENLATAAAGKPRDRVLSEDELKAAWTHACTSMGHFERIVALLILTGQRRGEIARLEWSWIGEGAITIPASVTKNARAHTFPVGPEARTVLESIPRFEGIPYVFPAARQRTKNTTVFNGWGKPKAAFDKACGVTGWTLHDLRRTFSSGMAALGVPQIVVEKLLNHVSGGTLSPIAAVYNRHGYMEEMRQAVLRWEAHLDTLCEPEA